MSGHFDDQDQGTQISLLHVRIASAELRRRHQDGWIGCLDGLAGFVGFIGRCAG